MGQYKVPQDVEAEDKIIGQYTLKQFIYAIIGVAYGFLSFQLLFAKLPVLFFLIGVPPTVLFLMLGLYRRKDQPFEALFLALVSYWTKPRRRLWIKEPITEVFKIVQPPIKNEVTQKDPGEVRSQLDHLAHLIDTHGVNETYNSATGKAEESPLLDLEERLIEPALVASRDIGSKPGADERDMFETARVAAIPTTPPAAAPVATTPMPQTPPADIINNNQATQGGEQPRPVATTPEPGVVPEGQSVSLRNG